MCEFPPVLYSKLLPHLKQRNYRDLCIDGIFKSLVAGIIEVPIRLYWSLTLIEDTSIKRRLLCSLLCRYLWCLYQKMSFQHKNKRAVAVRGCLQCENVLEYFIIGLALKSAVKWFLWMLFPGRLTELRIACHEAVIPGSRNQINKGLGELWSMGYTFFPKWVHSSLWWWV